ncbi:MAG: protein-tyrosine phosphatase family protein [Arcanobacterium sp.]|nr:protein-tyrosine phosphatase family protein [Arcanobacterium sp.]
MERWQLGEGVVEFPSGRRIRARSWKTDVAQVADLSIVLTTVAGKNFAAEHGYPGKNETIIIDWPDERLPRRTVQATRILRDVWERSEKELVEITCRGGVGRTGSALAIIATFEGMNALEAIDFVRKNYNENSVKSHAQRGFLLDFNPENNG